MSDNYIILGDSRTLHEKIKKRPIDLIVTDPPYGMSFQSNMSSTPQGKAIAKPIANDGDLKGALDLFVSVMKPLLPKCQPNTDVYVFTRWDLMQPWKDCIEQRLGLSVPMQLIWSKGDPGMGDLDACWGCGYEVILYCKKGRRPIPKRRSAVLTYDKVPPQKMIHPTEKPVDLIKALINMSSNPGDFVVDPFSGSGATSVAAMETGRDSLAMDLEPDYVERGKKRLEQQGFAFV